ncbi:MAG: cation transporter [Anaerolineales bacterium]|nr:cation transporter [Anaerolineales bacterium]
MSHNREKTFNPLLRFAWLSIGAAAATILLKGAAYLLTNSVGLLSDALESFVNLIGALMMMIMLTIAAQPPDEQHSYGHDKAEYFASGVEGILVLAAAVGIIFSAAERLAAPSPIDRVGVGLLISTAASAVNLVVARILLQASQRFQSIALEADSKHLMTDVWTSVGVIGGVAAVALTGWQILDPIIAILVALNILRTGWDLLRRTISGLMDTTLPQEEIETIEVILNTYKAQGVLYHALRTRQAGRRRFVSMHILAPGEWTIQQGHHLLEDIESKIRSAIPGIIVFTHIEPLEDEASWQDTGLDEINIQEKPWLDN